MTELRSLHLRGALSAARTELWNGREHLVVPCVALQEGVVHAVNAATPEYVSTAALTASHDRWNGHPLVVGHPTKDGKQISAHDDAVLAKHGFGLIRHGHMNGGRLGLEALVDPARLELLGQEQLLADIRAGKPIEVSVGAFVRTTSKRGEHNGKSYAGEWAEINPDHLAFLPNGVGACSVANGCGANRAAMRVCGDALELETLGGPGSGPQKGGGKEPTHGESSALGDKADRLQKTAEKSGKKEDFAKAAAAHQAAADSHKAGYRSTLADIHSKLASKMNDKSLKGLSMNLKSLRAKMLVLFDTPELKALDDAPLEDDTDEQAETISYEAMADLLDQAEASLASGKAHVTSLISENGPGDDEGIEDAHLEATVAMCVQLYGTINGVMKLATSQLAPDDVGSVPMSGYEAYRAALGKEISAKNAKSIQAAHDASHTMHTSTVALGAECNGMKLLEGTATSAEHATGGESAIINGGSDMTQQERTTALKTLGELKDANFTECDKKGLALLSDKGIAELVTLAGKSPADSIIQAKANADAALAGHAHGLNAQDAADTAKKAAADKAKAEADAEDAKDGGADDADEDKSGKKIKAAAAKPMTEEQYLKNAPESIRTLVAKQKAQDAARKSELIKALAGGPLTDKQLDAKPLDELETLAAFAKVEVVDYSGRGLAAIGDNGVYSPAPDPFSRENIDKHFGRKSAVN